MSSISELAAASIPTVAKKTGTLARRLVRVARDIGLMLVATMIVAPPVNAGTYPTIVGEWYAEQVGPQDCGGPYATHIGPMRYVEEGWVCSFDDVRRDGWKVTWNGVCSDGSTRSKTQVVAIEDNGSLAVWFNGNPGWSTLRRCKTRTVSAVEPPPPMRLPLNYASYAGDSDYARRYWPDVVDTLRDLGKDVSTRLTIYVASAGGYQFVSAESSFTCGMGWECPVRIVENDRIVGQFNTCADRSRHALASDGSRFFACETSGQGRLMSSLLRE